MKNFVKKLGQSLNIIRNLARDVLAPLLPGDATSTEPRGSMPELGWNRAQLRAHDAQQRKGGKPPHSWFTRTRTRGTRRSYAGWLGTLTLALSQQAVRVWGRP